MSTDMSKFQGSEIFWARYINNIYIPAVSYFGKVLSERLLPPFGNLIEEANNFAIEEMHRLTLLPPFCESDGGDVADIANDNALCWYSSMRALRQSIINLHAVGLRHLFEQQLFDIVHHVPLASGDNADYKKDLKALAYNGFDYQQFVSWPVIEELRLVCNAVKHAEGSASDQLKGLRPDLFTDPQMERVTLFNRPNLIVQPLAGEDIYLKETDIKKYADMIEMFWMEIGKRLEQLAVDKS